MTMEGKVVTSYHLTIDHSFYECGKILERNIVHFNMFQQDYFNNNAFPLSCVVQFTKHFSYVIPLCSEGVNELHSIDKEIIFTVN